MDNLPNDVARCAGVVQWEHRDAELEVKPHINCPHRGACERYLQIERDRDNWFRNYTQSVIKNCLVDGEYTARIET